jgi:hypothetical protein
MRIVTMNQIAILGDVHSDWTSLDIVLKDVFEKGITTIIQVGDFGYAWPKVSPWQPNVNRHHNVMDWRDGGTGNLDPSIKMFWLDGNHENFDVLDEDGGAWAYPYWEYCPRGTIKEFPEILGDAEIMLFGGATSVDKASRVPHLYWWPQENITYMQVMKAQQAACDRNIKAMFTHEHPDCVDYYKHVKGNAHFGSLAIKEMSRSDRVALQVLKETINPEFWFFGHHHRFANGTVDGLRWACAPVISSYQYLLWDGDDVCSVNAFGGKITKLKW